MHRIGQITASVKVNDLALGYELNHLLADLLDSDLDGELSALLDEYSTNSLIKLFEQVSIKIEIDEQENHRLRIKEEILRQLREILMKDVYDFENHLSSDRKGEFNIANPNISGSGKVISEVSLLKQYLTRFFQSGSSLELARFRSDELRRQIQQLIDTPSFEFIEYINTLVRQDERATLRIANFFTTHEIEAFLVEIAGRYSFSIVTINQLKDMLLNLTGTDDELGKKLILLSIMAYLKETSEKQLDSEIKHVRKRILSFQISSDTKKSDLIGADKQAGFKSTILQELILFEAYDFSAKVLQNTGKQLKILKEHFPQRDYNLKTDDFPIIQGIIESRQTQPTVQRSAWSYDIRHYLFSSFEFIVQHGTFPFWLRDDESQKLFLQLLRNILDSDVSSFKEKVKNLLLGIHDPMKIYSNIVSGFPSEVRTSLVNTLSENLPDTLQLFRHYYLNFKKRIIEERHVFSAAVKHFFEKDFSEFKMPIIDFMLAGFLEKKTFRTIKEIFSVFLIIHTEEPDGLTGPMEDMNYLFGQDFKVPDGENEIKSIMDQGRVKSKNVPDNDLIDSTPERITKGQNLNFELKIFEDFTENIQEQKAETYMEEYIQWMVDVASIDDYKLPDDIRLFVLNSGMQEMEKRKLAMAEFLHLIFTQDSWLISNKEFLKTAETFYREITSILGDIKDDIGYLKTLQAKIDQHPSDFKEFFVRANNYLGTSLSGFALWKDYIKQAKPSLLFSEDSVNDIRSFLALVSHLDQSDLLSFVSILDHEARGMYARIFMPDAHRPLSFPDKNKLPDQIIFDQIVHSSAGLHFSIDDETIQKAKQFFTKIFRLHRDLKYLRELEGITKDTQPRVVILNILEERQVADKSLKEIAETSGETTHLFDEALFVQLRSKYGELIAKIGPTELVKRLDTHLSTGELLKLSDTFISVSDIEFNLKRYVIYVGEKYGVPLHYVALALLDKLLNLGSSQFIFPQYKEVLYMMSFHLYDLALKLINAPKFISKDKEEEKVYNMPAWNLECDENMSIRVTNAGLVICNPFIVLLFQRLGLLTPEKKIKDNESINKAVIVLNYLSYGDIGIKEFNLGLNNVLCNVPRNFYYDFSVELTPEEKELCDSLLENICNQWTALKNTSPDGLRHNFFIREGSLSYDGTSYKLVVAEKAYDILISKVPWTIGTIKFPWMESFLFTDWKY